jgi:hypothetical protein
MSNNSLVLIGVISTLGVTGRGLAVRREHPGITPHADISARKANTLGTGGSLPRIAMGITYRPENLRLNPTGAKTGQPRTKIFVVPIQSRRRMPISSGNTVL